MIMCVILNPYKLSKVFGCVIEKLCWKFYGGAGNKIRLYKLELGNILLPPLSCREHLEIDQFFLYLVQVIS